MGITCQMPRGRNIDFNPTSMMISDEAEERNLRRISYLKAREDDRLATPDLVEDDGGGAGGGFVAAKK